MTGQARYPQTAPETVQRPRVNPSAIENGLGSTSETGNQVLVLIVTAVMLVDAGLGLMVLDDNMSAASKAFAIFLQQDSAPKQATGARSHGGIH